MALQKGDSPERRERIKGYGLGEQVDLKREVDAIKESGLDKSFNDFNRNYRNSPSP